MCIHVFIFMYVYIDAYVNIDLNLDIRLVRSVAVDVKMCLIISGKNNKAIIII